jgi:hypothetical protein
MKATQARSDTGLDVRVLAQLAYSQKDRFETVVPMVVAAFHSPPPSISPNLWAYAVARAPFNKDAQRDVVARYWLYVDIFNTANRLEQPAGDGMEFGAVMRAETAPSAEDVLLGDKDPLRVLPRLIKDAGLTNAELRRLLMYYDSANTKPMSRAVAATLTKLQAVVHDEINA